MNTNRLRQAPDNGAIVNYVESCNSCSACWRRSSQVNFSGSIEKIDHSMLAQVRSRILWNSLGKPIVYLVVATLVADIFGLSDFESLVLALTGFVFGYRNCVAFPETLLEKTGVS